MNGLKEAEGTEKNMEGVVLLAPSTLCLATRAGKMTITEKPLSQNLTNFRGRSFLGDLRESARRRLAQKVSLKFLEPTIFEESHGTAVYVMASVHLSLPSDASGQSH